MACMHGITLGTTFVVLAGILTPVALSATTMQPTTDDGQSFPGRNATTVKTVMETTTTLAGITTIPPGIQSESTSSAAQDGCQCSEGQCGCCVKLWMFFNNQACTHISFISEEPAMLLTVVFNDRVVFNRSVSARDPPPACFTVIQAPLLDRIFKLCLKFYNMTYSTSSIAGCSRIEVTLLGQALASYELGCFDVQTRN